MNKALKDIINDYENPGDFTYATVNSDMLLKAETELNLKIPESYKEFLLIYGHGGIGGVEILGIGKSGRNIFKETTLEYRKFGLPVNYIVIENCDEWIYCIDSNNGKILSWTQNTICNEFNSFDDYLLDRFTDAIDNM